MIRDQGDKQLHLIGGNLGKRKNIGFQDKRLNDLKKEIDEKEIDMLKGIRSVDEKERKKAGFVYTTTNGTPFDFSDYKHLMRFAGEVYNKKLSFNKAKEEQEKMKKINDLKKKD